MTELDAPPGVHVRLARPADAQRMAELHRTRISEGFLPSLGAGFLTRLYRRITRSGIAFGYVVETGEDGVASFTTGAEDVGRLYKEFLLRDGVVAGALAAPKLPRAWRRVLETLRYPASTSSLPDAEILAVATDEAAVGRGYGALALRAATAELARRGHDEVKVTVGGDNTGALAFYRACGYVTRAEVAVHGDARSEVMVWAAR